MPYSDLSAYALMTPRQAVRTYVREHGMAGLRGLGQAVASDVAWSNLIQSMEWLNANPLPDEPVEPVMGAADPFYAAWQAADANWQAASQARQLVIAALVAAENTLQSAPTSGSTSPQYQAAAAAYQAYAAQAYQADMPSPFALNPLAALFGSGGVFDLSTVFGKVAVYGGALLAAYVLLPPVLRGMRGSKSL